ncbi:MAG: NfeD family protein [Alistipes sp.]|nr:NfeD family protein [Alistipes sp.]
MGFVAFLVLLGVFFLVLELIFLPGVTLGTILSVVSYGIAIYFGFARMGVVGGFVTMLVVVALSLVATVVSLRAKTWQRLALNNKIDSQSSENLASIVEIGAKGVTISRLSPMGKVQIGGKVYEAKSEGAYIEQRTEVEVVGFENFTIFVKRV